MTSQGTPHGRFQRAIQRGHVQAAEMAAREMGGLSLADARMFCELLANGDPARYERAALRWLQRFIDERLPPLAEVALAASALAELRHGQLSIGSETLRRLLRRARLGDPELGRRPRRNVVGGAPTVGETAPEFPSHWFRRDWSAVNSDEGGQRRFTPTARISR
jgi:glutathione S-transferase